VYAAAVRSHSPLLSGGDQYRWSPVDRPCREGEETDGEVPYEPVMGGRVRCRKVFDVWVSPPYPGGCGRRPTIHYPKERGFLRACPYLGIP
jgi:hypothetical protein